MGARDGRGRAPHRSGAAGEIATSPELPRPRPSALRRPSPPSASAAPPPISLPADQLARALGHRLHVLRKRRAPLLSELESIHTYIRATSLPLSVPRRSLLSRSYLGWGVVELEGFV